MVCKQIHNASKNLDPTGTTTIRRMFLAQVNKRFRWIKGQILKKVKESPWMFQAGPVGQETPFPSPMDVVNAQYGTGYEFLTSAERASLFLEWLDEMQYDPRHPLFIEKGDRQVVSAHAHWSDVYIDSGYKKGMRDAFSQAGVGQAVGMSSSEWVQAAFLMPIHADRVGLLHSRVFEEMRGVTDAMRQNMSRVLAEGMSEGRHPYKIARELNQRVDGIGLRRARMIARTETIRAHAEAALNTYESFQVEGVEMMLEWDAAATACPICADLQSASPYTVEDARGIIPVHPNCKCSWVPVTDPLVLKEWRKK